jgi:hypothetical protein
MAPEAETGESEVSKSWRRSLRWPFLAVVAVLAVAIAMLWANREGIAGNIIADQLASRGIEATYEIERIGGTRQVLRDIVVGDAARPDLTVERAEVVIRYRFGFPAISRVHLVRPRLYGTYRDGALSFGSLDPLIFTGEEGPFVLPDFDLRLTDGRALIEGDFGPVGIKAEGRGNLSNGFAGVLAATAPSLAIAGCEAPGATLYGRVAVTGRRPSFAGPLRAARLACAEQGFSVANAAVQLDISADEALAAFEGDAGLRGGAVLAGGARLAGIAGDSRFTWRDGGLTARYDLTGTGVDMPQASIARIALDGALRARRNFARIELDADVTGNGLRPGAVVDTSLAGVVSATEDTLLGPILAQIRSQLALESRNSTFAAEVTVRQTGTQLGVVVPGASLRGASGASLLAVSRLQFTRGGDAPPQFSGNFATGGEGLPRLSGRMERRSAGGFDMRLSMAEFRAGASRLEIPELTVAQASGGELTFTGGVEASGALPGGLADRLVLPVSGSWSPAGGLALWNECADVRFERLQFANLALGRQSLRLCPPRGAPILRYGANGLRIAAGATGLSLAGRLGETPIAVRSGPIGFAWPGAVSARRLAVTLGPADTASTFVIDDLTARLGEDIAGRFTGTDVRLAATPLDLLGATGNWRYANGRLALTDGEFRLEDRTEPDRFNPLVARDAVLSLEDNLISAQALLREPVSDRAVARVDLRHDLSRGSGSADLAVEGLLFDEALQPLALSELSRGVVANVRGTVTGTGRIDWNETAVTSTGRFSSDSLDLAAAFGPVRGASGTVEFTDLLSLTTAPNQSVRVASINPGIEVNDGVAVFEMQGGELLSLQGGTWPFMGGTLTMRPVDIRFGAAEVRRYVLEMEGLDAALFVQRMELGNISASGTFDGTIPIVFDEMGNGRIEGGLLISRPPGGNVSYVGELTYEDLSPMANFAFDTLRSLDYRQMRVAMDGPLTGEIVTRVRFDGVRQGEGAGEGFASRLASRAVAGLPIRFDVNIRASFYQLMTSVRALYDPAAIRDPRELGLLDAQGNVIRRETDGEPMDPPTEPTPDEPAIQRRESEEMP